LVGVIERETRQVEQANASGRAPVVFIHGLWLLPSSWDRWAELFEDAGYAAVTPSWPDDPETIADARANPEVFAGKTLGQVADHTAEVIGGLEKKPAVMGHSTGGLLAQIVPTGVCPRRRWRSIPGRFAVCCRCRSQRCGRRARCFETP
jgi:non-heme chloroperoxidase